MNVSNNEKNIINEYIKTIKRFNNLKIPKNIFLKNPYIENYLIKISDIDNDYELIKKILSLLNDDIITNEDILFIINYYFDITKQEKSNIFKFLNNTDQNLIKNNIEIVIFNIRYFRFYLIITELLFDSDNDNDELYFYLYLLNEGDEKKLKFYRKKYLNFKLIYELYSILLENYNKINKFLIERKLINNEKNNNNLFKNIFKEWFNIYLNDSGTILIDEKINKYIIKKNNIFSKFVCNNNI